MSLYELLLFAHITAAAIWFGGGVILLILGARLSAARDNAGLESLFRQANFIAMKVFTPLGLLVLLFGILLVLEGPWTFGMLWIVLGLIGFAATFVVGLFALSPKAKAIAAAIERDGRMTPQSAEATDDLFRHMRIDYAVLAAVIADMALKPTADDVAALIAMAALVVIVAVFTLRGARTRRPLEAGDTA